MSEDPEKKEERGFVVIDRRGRDEEEPQQSSEAPEASQAAPASPPGEETERPKVDFSMLILSVSHSAFYHLGLVEDPATGKAGPVDKALARNDIDLLEVLEEKTRGNLTSEEEHLLSSLLYDLRLRFVEAAG